MSNTVGISVRVPADVAEEIKSLREKFQRRANQAGLNIRITRTDTVVRMLRAGIETFTGKTLPAPGE